MFFINHALKLKYLSGHLKVKGVNWIHTVKGRYYWQVPPHTVIVHLQDPNSTRNYLSREGNIILLRKTLLCGINSLVNIREYGTMTSCTDCINWSGDYVHVKKIKIIVGWTCSMEVQKRNSDMNTGWKYQKMKPHQKAEEKTGRWHVERHCQIPQNQRLAHSRKA